MLPRASELIHLFSLSDFGGGCGVGVGTVCCVALPALLLAGALLAGIAAGAALPAMLLLAGVRFDRLAAGNGSTGPRCSPAITCIVIRANVCVACEAKRPAAPVSEKHTGWCASLNHFSCFHVDLFWVKDL